ncbi:molting protein mlt-4 [Anaeramoeba ignava]|uniref:Molting protein mlt-4 n=1 Tax=Anaeramoeba ignava TaxID=1746090 RepID=A0A9Q0LVN1_ANAIG|nr:molting protein mlt-4 [Anaeramoeba ignava]
MELNNLFKAIKENKKEVIEEFIASKKDINKVDENKNTVFHICAKTGNIENFKLLYNSNADLNIHNFLNKTPLDIAKENNHLEIVSFIQSINRNLKKELSQQFSKEENIERKFTDLHKAILTGEIKKAKELIIEGKIDKEYPAKNGETPLMMASQSESDEIVELLLTYPEVNINRTSDNGRTALHFASSSNRLKSLKMLVDSGGDINIQSLNGETCLHLSAFNGQVDTTKFLLEKGANPFLKSFDQHTPLDLAIINRHQKLIHFLRLNGCPTKLNKSNLATECLDLLQSIKIFRAVLDNNPQELINLIEKNTPINITKEGFSLLHIAANQGFSTILSVLLSYGANFNQDTPNGLTALHLASSKGHVKCVQLLIKFGSEINKQNKEGFTALHLACLNGHAKCAEELLNSKADTTIETYKGMTAFTFCVFTWQRECISILIKKKVNVNHKPKKGLSALQLSAFLGKEEICIFLLQNGATLIGLKPTAHELAAKK